jgi:hypothetical protein
MRTFDKQSTTLQHLVEQTLEEIDLWNKVKQKAGQRGE